MGMKARNQDRLQFQTCDGLRLSRSSFASSNKVTLNSSTVGNIPNRVFEDLELFHFIGASWGPNRITILLWGSAEGLGFLLQSAVH